MKHSPNERRLFAVKLTHTLIWFVMVAAVLYVCYAGIVDQINALVWFCIALIVIEGIILLMCKWRCPLTILARKYTDDQPVGFDIFIPAWLAKHNKTIFTTIFLAGTLLVLWRTIW